MHPRVQQAAQHVARCEQQLALHCRACLLLPLLALLLLLLLALLLLTVLQGQLGQLLGHGRSSVCRRCCWRRSRCSRCCCLPTTPSCSSACHLPWCCHSCRCMRCCRPSCHVSIALVCV
jgi:hypothetical protein